MESVAIRRNLKKVSWLEKFSSFLQGTPDFIRPESPLGAFPTTLEPCPKTRKNMHAKLLNLEGALKFGRSCETLLPQYFKSE